jgi:hypothetical protein
MYALVDSNTKELIVTAEFKESLEGIGDLEELEVEIRQVERCVMRLGARIIVELHEVGGEGMTWPFSVNPTQRW